MPQGIQRSSTNRPNGLNYQPFKFAIIPEQILAPDVIVQTKEDDSFYALSLTTMQLSKSSTHSIQKERAATVSGGYGGGDPPVPIPNTEVKPSRVEDT